MSTQPKRLQKKKRNQKMQEKSSLKKKLENEFQRMHLKSVDKKEQNSDKFHSQEDEDSEQVGTEEDSSNNESTA